MPREECRIETCRATFEPVAPHDGAIQYCNRGGPDGGHPNRWDGNAWHAAGDRMEHDRA
jgi:hypothetical protein